MRSVAYWIFPVKVVREAGGLMAQVERAVGVKLQVGFRGYR